MGKFILILLISSFLALNVDAQDAVPAKMEVRYLMSYVADTIKNTVLTDTFCLRMNDKKSLFYEQDTYMKDSLRHYDRAKWSDMMSKALTPQLRKTKVMLSIMCSLIMSIIHIFIRMVYFVAAIAIQTVFLPLIGRYFLNTRLSAKINARKLWASTWGGNMKHGLL